MSTYYDFDSRLVYTYEDGILSSRTYSLGSIITPMQETAPEIRDKAYYAEKYYSVYMEAMMQAERDLTVPADRYRRLLHMFNVYRKRCGW